MYTETRLQSTLVTKNSYNKGIQSCVECARNRLDNSLKSNITIFKI